MKKLSDKELKNMRANLRRKITLKEKEIDEIMKELFELPLKHHPHKGKLTLAGSVKKRINERKCIVCGAYFRSKTWRQK